MLNTMIVRYEGELYAMFQLQNELTGNFSTHFRKVRIIENDYTVRVEGKTYIVSQQVKAFRSRED